MAVVWGGWGLWGVGVSQEVGHEDRVTSRVNRCQKNRRSPQGLKVSTEGARRRGQAGGGEW